MILPRAFVMFIVLALTQVADARLGETLPELVARFGETVGKHSVTVFVDGRPREVGQAVRFRVDDWALDAVMIEGRCARIRYAKSGPWTDDQIAAVLDVNAQEHTWTEQPPSAHGRTWHRADGATAAWEKDRAITLELPLYAERTHPAKDAGAPPRRTRRR